MPGASDAGRAVTAVALAAWGTCAAPIVGMGQAVANQGVSLFFDREHRILLARLGRLLTAEAIDGVQRAVSRFIAVHGRCRAIADMSAVEEVNIESRVMAGFGQRRALLYGEQRVLVAPRADVFGLARMFGMTQAATGDEPLIVRRIEDAYQALGLKDPKFEPVILD